MPRVSKKIVLDAAKKLGVNLEVVPLDTLYQGFLVELEHGTHCVDKKGCPKTNLTNNDPVMTLQIVMAHLMEGLDYYKLLDKLEKRLEEKAKGRPKLKLFL